MSDRKLLLNNVKRKVKQLFEDETLYTHEVWWRLFEKRDNGIPIEQLRAFGGDLNRDDIVDVVTEAFSDKATHDSSIIIVDGHIRPEPRPSEANHLYKRTVFATPIPFRATEEDIANFFKKYGNIDKIDRREWRDHATDKVRLKPGIFVVYANPESAQRCIDAKPSYTRTNDIGKYMVPELIVKLRTDNEKAKPDARLENQYLYKIRDSVEGTAGDNTVAQLSAEACEHLQLDNIVVVEGTAGCHWRDVRAFYESHLKSIRNEVVFTHLSKERRASYLFVKNIQNLDFSAVSNPITFRELSLSIRKATPADMEYLTSLPTAADDGEPNPKKHRAA